MTILGTTRKNLISALRLCGVASTISLGAAVSPALADPPPGSTATWGHVGGSLYVHFGVAPPSGTVVNCQVSFSVSDQYGINYTAQSTATVNGSLAICNFNSTYLWYLATPANDTMTVNISAYPATPSNSSAFPAYFGAYYSQYMGSVAVPASNAWTVVSQDIYF
jgi:hypothetical protein